MAPIVPPPLLASGMVSNAYAGTWRWINHLDRQGWMIVLCCAVVIGFFLLRGFGSRSNY